MDYKIGSTYTFAFTLHDADPGGLVDADDPPAASVFEDDTDAPIDSPTVEKIGAIVGYYRVIVYLDPTKYSANKSYNVMAAATSGGVDIAVRVIMIVPSVNNTDDVSTSVSTVDGKADDIQAQTDKLTFDGSNRVSANVTAMDDGVIVASKLGLGAITADKIAASALDDKGNWSKAGDEMDLVNAPNATAVAAIQSGLATSSELVAIPGEVWDALKEDHELVGSFGESVPADLILLRGDATAAGFLKKQYDGTGAVDPTFPATQAQADALITAVGTPVALDSGDASIAGMLTKMADDNGGADFDAETDSLHEIAISSGGGATPAQIWAYLLTGDEGTGSAAAALMAAVRTAPVPLVKVNDIFNLRTDIEEQLLSVGIDPTQNLRWRWKTVDRFGNAVTGFPSTVMLSGTELFAQFVGGDLNYSPYKFTLYVRQYSRPEGPWLVADYGIMLGEL